MAGVSSDLSSTGARVVRGAGIWQRVESVAPKIVFVVSVATIAFFVGFYITERHWFPYRILHNAVKTTDSVYAQLFPPFGPLQFIGFSDVAPAVAASDRIEIRQPFPGAPGNEHFLMAGGLNQYLDYCPHYGCIAVEYTRMGKLVHVWPYRPDLLASHETVSLPYEDIWFRFTTNAYPIGLLKL